jgi:predicted nuclease with TOPRIM domain
MTDEELIARLRDWPYQGETMAVEAADRIEELVAINEALTAENAYLERVVKDLSDEVDLAEQEACMLETDLIKVEKEAEELEAKLAEAEEELQKIAAVAKAETGHNLAPVVRSAQRSEALPRATYATMWERKNE